MRIVSIRPGQLRSLTLAATVLLAFLLRLWGIGFGLPYLYHYDEHFYVNTALNLGAGVLNNPPYAATGLSNILFIKYAGYFVVGKLFGWFTNAQDFATAARSDPTALYLLARVTVALMGVATILVVYSLSKKTTDRKTGLIASGFLACSFLHVRDSHYAVPDIAMTLFVVVALNLAMNSLLERKKQAVYWAGLAGGLAVGMKWTGLVVTFTVLLASMFLSRSTSILGKVFGRTVLQGIALLALGFALSSPQILANPAPYLKEVLGQYQAGAAGGFEIWQVDTLPGWLFYGRTLCWGIGLPLLLLGLIGMTRRLVLALRGDRISGLLVSFPLIYFLLMGATRHYFARYALPLVPFAALFGAEALAFAEDHARLNATRLRTLALIVIIWVAVAHPLATSVRHNAVLTRTDTRTSAKAWIEANIPEGAKIAVDWPVHGPPLASTDRATPFSEVVFDVTVLGGSGLADHPLAWYEAERYDYLITTSYIENIPLLATERNSLRKAFYASLDQELRLAKSFWPNETCTEPPFVFDEIYGPAVSVWQRDRPGPVIKIYEVFP